MFPRFLSYPGERTLLPSTYMSSEPCLSNEHVCSPGNTHSTRSRAVYLHQYRISPRASDWKRGIPILP